MKPRVPLASVLVGVCADLGLSSSETQCAINGYLATFGSLLLFAGRYSLFAATVTLGAALRALLDGLAPQKSTPGPSPGHPA